MLLKTGGAAIPLHSRMETLGRALVACAFLTVLLLPLPSPAGAGLIAENCLVIANSWSPKGTEIARYYMARRGIPSRNLLMVATSREEQISREEYERQIASPVRAFLAKNDPEGRNIACLVLVYGMPLRIMPPKLTPAELKTVADLSRQHETLQASAKAVEKSDPQKAKALNQDAVRVQWEIQRANRSLEGASVDSELALVREETYSLAGWVPNRFFIAYKGKVPANAPSKVVVVSRLDGPMPEIARRIVDDSIEAERAGLKGKAYFDARWKERADVKAFADSKTPGDGKISPAPKLSAYEVYDQAIRIAARVVERSGRMPVVLDEQERLFQPGEAPDAALYCGWYSLANYVDAFRWAKGAVGFHIASSECTTLKTPSSRVWCKMMLEKGVAATIGPVAEPYVQAFPLPDVFFGCLLEGNSLAECYAVSNPMWSWQMVMIGDPLYRPFKQKGNGEKQ